MKCRVIFVGSQSLFSGDHIDHTHIIEAFFPFEVSLVCQGFHRYGERSHCDAQPFGDGAHGAAVPAGDHGLDDMELTHREIGKLMAAGKGPILQLQDRIEGVDQECIDFFTLHAGVPPYAGGNNGLCFEFQRVSNNISLTGSFVKEGAATFSNICERPQRGKRT